MIETRTQNPDALQAMRIEAENPPALYEPEPVETEAIEEQAQPAAQGKKAHEPELVIEETLLDRICDGLANRIDKDADGWHRRTAMRLRGAPAFLRTIISGLVSAEEKAERDQICIKCDHVVVAIKLIDGERRVREKYFCGGCDCPRWWMAELRRWKNWFRGHQCPRMRHPRTTYGVVTIWRWIKASGFKGRIPEGLGRQ